MSELAGLTEQIKVERAKLEAAREAERVERAAAREAERVANAQAELDAVKRQTASLRKSTPPPSPPRPAPSGDNEE